MEGRVKTLLLQLGQEIQQKQIVSVVFKYPEWSDILGGEFSSSALWQGEVLSRKVY
jgi:hypothetical protein